MVQVQIFAIENAAAILARVLVPLKNVVARKLDFLFRQMIEHDQQNHARHANAERDGADGFGMRFLSGEIMPFAEVVSPKRAIVAIEDRLGMPLKEKRQRTTRRADINGLP